MLQLSDICKMGEDVQMAMELIERTLYAMESAFHPLFNIAAGCSRLDYRRQENRLGESSTKRAILSQSTSLIDGKSIFIAKASHLFVFGG